MNKVIDILEDKFTGRRKNLYPYIVMIGSGGNGGYLAQQIAQLMSIFNQRGQFVIADPDIVEEKNLRNQLFIERDIGKSKADVLAQRYSAAYNIPIGSYSETYIEDINTLDSLFSTEYLNIGSSFHNMFLPIVIGAVDNNYTRKIIHQYFTAVNHLLYIDVGIEAAHVPDDFGQRPIEEWTEEEKRVYQNSGWSGQVVCGLKLDRKTILPPVAEVFPEILEDDDEIAPSQIACSDIVANDPQRLLTNRMAAMSVMPYINELFESGTISHHITFFHAQKGFMKSQPICA